MPIPQVEIIIDLDGVELSRTVLNPGGYVIGSDPAADIVALADGVARYHAHLTVTPGEMRIKDLGSESGTYVGGVLVAETTRVWPNQKILIGPAVMEVRLVRQSGIEQTLPPPIAAARRILPEEFLRDRKYEIEGTLGQGGMGAVLSARETTTHRTVAMKVMLANISEADVIRFISEAQITSQLEHPNIVPVHELGVNEHDQVFYTMKHVQGMNLRAVLKKLRQGDPAAMEAYPLRRLLVILLRVCDAMAFAHSRGIIHRDLKPDNVMIGDFGEVLVMDWGLAKVMDARPGDRPLTAATEPDLLGDVTSVRSDEEESLTVVGALVGTPRYMSPEQARGESDTLDERTDIWALGAILRHILTLARPVPGDTADEIMANVRAGRLAPIPEEAPHCPGGHVPDSLSAVAQKAQALRKEDRYATVGEFRGEIDAYLGGFATSAERASALRQCWLFMMRHRTLTVMLLIFFVVSLVFVSQLIASEHRSEQNAQTARRNELSAQRNEVSARAAEALAVQQKEISRQALAQSQVSLADAAYREANSPMMLAALESVPGDLRGSEWRYLRANADNSQSKIFGSAKRWYVANAPHPKRPGIFALSTNAGGVILADAGTGKKLFDFKIIDRQRRFTWFRTLAFSPDGNLLAVGSLGNGGAAIYRLKDGACELEWDGINIETIQFNEDGRKILAVEDSLDLTVRDPSSGRVLMKYSPCLRACFLPGDRVAVSHGSSLRIINATTGAVERTLPKLRSNITSIALSPDGKTLYSGQLDGRVQGINLADGNTTFDALLTGRGGWIRLSVDQQYIVAATGAADHARALAVWDTRNGVQLRPLLGGGTSNIEGLSIHPLSGDILVSGPETRAWNLASRAPQWTVKGSFRSSVFWSPEDWFCAFGEFAALSKEGKLKPLPGPWPAETRESGLATAAGDIAVLAKGNRIDGRHEITVMQRTEAGLKRLQRFENRNPLSMLRLSPGGEYIAEIDYYAGCQVHETATATALPPLAVKGLRNIYDAAWLSKNSLAAVVSTTERGVAENEDRVVLWNPENGQIVKQVRCEGVPGAIAAAPDGKSLAEGGLDRRVRIRDGSTLGVIREFRAHDGPITALAYHPAKPILATGSADFTIRLWSLETGEMMEEIRVPAKEPRTLHFSASGSFLACSDAFSSTHIWDIRAPFVKLREAPLLSPELQATTQRQRAQTLARASQWSEAATALKEAIRAQPAHPDNWFQLAPLLVQTGDLATYRQFAHDLIARFGGSTDPTMLERMAKAVTLAPIDDADRARAMQFAFTASSHRNHDYFRWFQLAKGLAQYRAGEFPAAVETLRTFQQPVPGWLIPELDGLAVLAMALHRMGLVEEGESVLIGASQQAARKLPTTHEYDQTDAWHDILTVRLLLDEAAGVIQGR